MSSSGAVTIRPSGSFLRAELRLEALCPVEHHLAENGPAPRQRLVDQRREVGPVDLHAGDAVRLGDLDEVGER